MTMKKHEAFAAGNRSVEFQTMANNELDVLVIGGGITGAGIAWDAASRGLRIGLVEMRDFAWGTSSRSTKLVHGGLRYLKQGEINLVREVGRERALLYAKAPHIVIPAPMMLPVYKGGTYGYWMSSIGLYVYDWLAGVKRSERRRMFGKEETLRREPLLKPDAMKGSGYYFEYRTDDARLTVEIMKSAKALGAQIVNYARAEEFIYDTDGKAVGVKVIDTISGEAYTVYAKTIVNAAGPWVDRVREMDRSKEGKHLLLTKGVHLVVDQRRLPVSQALYFDVSDGRMIFVIPRGKKTYLGTTDTVYNGDIGHPRTTAADRDYLLKAVNDMLPEVRLTPDDVESSWAGLRPLIHEEGKSPSEVSRKDEVFISRSGLISIAGGKLTGFRKMAQKVVDLVADTLRKTEGRDVPSCRTQDEPISGGDFAAHGDFPSYDRFRSHMIEEGIRLGASRDDAEYLVDVYGGNTPLIYRTAAASEHGEASERLLAAEIDYAVTHEMAVTARDFLIRRTGLLFFDRKRAARIAGFVVDQMAVRLGWSGERRARELAEVEADLREAVEFPEG